LSDLAGLVLVNACFLAAGAGVSALCGWWAGRRELRRSLGVSYLAGIATFGVLAQLLYVVGASMSRWQVIAVCALPACGIVFGLTRVREPRHYESLRFGWLCAAVVAMFGLIAFDLWYQPLWAYDSWTFWTPKAHALYALGGLKASWFTSADLANKDYPMLLPSIEAAGFRFTGYETHLLDLQSWFVFVAFVRMIYEVVAPRGHALVLWAVLTMLVAAPSTTNQLAAAEADIPVAALAAAAGLCTYRWLGERRRGFIAMTAVLAAGASATKVEGLVFVLSLFAAATLVVAITERPRAAIEPLAAAAAAIAVAVVPWRLWLSSHHVPTQASLSRSADVAFLFHHVGRLPIALAYVLAKLFDPRAWLFLAPLAVLALCAAGRRIRPQVGFVILYPTLSLLGLVLAYWSTPLPFHYHLATSARRVVTEPVFFLAAVTPLLATSPEVGAISSIVRRLVRPRS
jgi:hypothetical protein